MKKLFALLLTLVLVLSFGVTALAVGSPNMTSEATTYSNLVKVKYTSVPTGSLFPKETLSFTSTADSSNPDTDTSVNLQVNPLTINGNDNQYLTIQVPSYDTVGLYHYTITMDEGNTQGVTYSDEEIKISVLVEYDYKSANQDGYGLKATVGITLSGDGQKHNTFTNMYSLGSLKVSKEVTGNLGSQSQKFDIDVTFSSNKPVLSDITYGGGEVDNPVSWSQSESGSEYTATVTVQLAHGENVTFSDIPAGVTYTVTEQAKHEVQDPNGSNPKTGYTVTYEAGKNDGTIVAKTLDTVKVINTKSTSVDTGIVLDSLPYVLLIAVAVVGVVIFTARKRSHREY